MRRLIKLGAILLLGWAAVRAWARVRGGRAPIDLARWRGRIGLLVGRARPDFAEHPGGNTRPIPFEWVTRADEALRLGETLGALGIGFVTRPAGQGVVRSQMLRSKLRAAGMQFDQEPTVPVDAATYVLTSGAASAQALADAIEQFQRVTMTGLVADVSMQIVEIDSHRDLGARQLVLIDTAGAHQLRSGTRRALMGALHAAASRQLPAEFRDIPGRGAVHHEFAGFPHTLDGLIAELGAASIPGGQLSYERAERLGALRHCNQCATPIVDIAVLSSLVAEFYAAPRSRQQVANALVASGLETGDTLSPNYCASHGELTPTSNQ